MVLRKFSLKVSCVYRRIKQVLPTDVSPIMTIFISASNVSAIGNKGSKLVALDNNTVRTKKEGGASSFAKFLAPPIVHR